MARPGPRPPWSASCSASASSRSPCSGSCIWASSCGGQVPGEAGIRSTECPSHGSLGVGSLWRAWTRIGPQNRCHCGGPAHDPGEPRAPRQRAGRAGSADPRFAGVRRRAGHHDRGRPRRRSRRGPLRVAAASARRAAPRRPGQHAGPRVRAASANRDRVSPAGRLAPRAPSRRCGRRRRCEPRPSPSRARSPTRVHEGRPGHCRARLVEDTMLRRLRAAPSFAIASAFALASAAIIAPVTTAHSAQEAGDYTLEIGWLNEPAYVAPAERRPGDGQGSPRPARERSRSG